MVAISGGMVTCKSKNSNLSIFLKQSASVFVYPFYTLFVDFCFIMRPKVDWLAIEDMVQVGNTSGFSTGENKTKGLWSSLIFTMIVLYISAYNLSYVYIHFYC